MAPLREQRYRPSGTTTEELPSDLAAENLSDGGRHSVADLALDRAAFADELVVVGEGLQSSQLAVRELAALPVKRTRRWPRLRLNRPARAVFGELEEERPESRAPPK
jgi:hypothetical protein